MSEPSHVRKTSTSWLLTPLFAIVLPVAAAAALLFWLDPFEPVQIPVHSTSRSALAAAGTIRNDHMLRGSDKVGEGHMMGPEDLVYDAATGVVYTGCVDGWIKRVRLNDSVVEDWVNTGGRPLGLAFDQNGDLIVADADKVKYYGI